MEKIVELVRNKEYDKLKAVLENKLVEKVKEHIDNKKEAFIEKMRSASKKESKE